VNHQAQMAPLLRVAATDQWLSPPPKDVHAFVCQNRDPNTSAIADSLWVRESQVMRERAQVNTAADLLTDSQQPRLIPAFDNTDSMKDAVCADAGAAEPLQQLQKCVDTSDLEGERHEVPAVTVGSDLNAEVPWHGGSKGQQAGLRGSRQRWPLQNSARGTTSQRVRLHALYKRRDGHSRVDREGFEPSIKARNWNLADNFS
jgi:hypothetical protein